MAKNNSFQFPKGFVWGTATASAQIEGGAFEGGKAPSIWDTFARQPGAIANQENLDIACDHYHRFRSDFKLMKSLGIKNYRFSFAWGRLFPKNNQQPNLEGVRFYRKLIESMVENGITPWATMYHWDLPQYFQDQGGWLNPKMPQSFSKYAEFLVKTYGDLVSHWFTLNEVSCFIYLGYGSHGNHAPGWKKTPQEVNQATHHALLAHGYGVRAVREFGSKKSKVGMAENTQTVVPISEESEMIHAAQELFQEYNAPIMGAMRRGEYDEYYRRRVIRKQDRPKVLKGDFGLMSEPVDFIGVNIYTATFAGLDSKNKPVAIPFPEGYPTADSPWLKLIPRALYWGTRFLQDGYGAKSIYITENGFGYKEPAEVKGAYYDLHRKEYYRLYLEQAHRAIQDGVPLHGYFAWSFMDNFEWADGYQIRFGLVHTNYKTQKRTPKFSAHWYSKVIQKNALV